MQELTDNISVLIRIRPRKYNDNEANSIVSYKIDDENDNTIILESMRDIKSFRFDLIFKEESTQQEIFNKISDLIVKYSLEGKKSCINSKMKATMAVFLLMAKQDQEKHIPFKDQTLNTVVKMIWD
jgi:hypothetical protein